MGVLTEGSSGRQHNSGTSWMDLSSSQRAPFLRWESPGERQRTCVGDMKPAPLANSTLPHLVRGSW